MPPNDRVRQEIQAFLRAVESYPQRVARNPRVSFDEHRAELMYSPAQARASRRKRSKKS